jgi:DNA-binding CsgD family transcriptional regulator
MARRGRPRHPDILTPREWEVLSLIREGLSNAQIAERLGISVDAAKYHVSEILSRIGVSSREEAAAWKPEPPSAQVLRPAWARAFVRWWPALAWLGAGAALAGVGLLIWGAAHSGGDDDSQALQSATSSPASTISPAPTAPVGQPITPSDATASLPTLGDPDHYWYPLVGSGDEIILASMPTKSLHADTDPWNYYLWDVKSGAMTQLWSDPGGTQENASVLDGDWYIAVRRGFGGTGAYDQWTLTLRNIQTGELRNIAQADPGAPTHDSPRGYLVPGISGGHVVWADTVAAGDGSPRDRIRLYDIQTGQTTSVAEADTANEQLWSSSVHGDWVAWLYTDDTSTEVRSHNLATGQEFINPAGDDAYSASLMTDQLIVWDEQVSGGSYDKHLLDFHFGYDQIIAAKQGFGTYVDERFFSWDPATISGGQVPSGLYDLQADSLRPLIPTLAALTNVGHVIGNWFVWQNVPLVGSEYRDDQGHWDLMPLPD